MALPRLKYDILILDGLFVTQNDVEWVLSVYLNNPKFTDNFTVEKIIVDSWIPDKEACLWNDRGRRNIGAAVSIQLLEQEKIDVKISFEAPLELGLHGIKKSFNQEIESSQTKFHRGSIRSGKRIEYEGSIVVLGDVNGGAEVTYKADDVITLGAGAAYDEKTVLVLKGISEEDNSEDPTHENDNEQTMNL